MYAHEAFKEATRLHLAGNLAQAEFLYCKLIAHDEQQPEIIFRLGTLYAQAHAHGRAIFFLKRAIELMPKGNGAMENLAAVYREMENREQARYWGERALAIESTPIALSNMAGSFINDATPNWPSNGPRRQLPSSRFHRQGITRLWRSSSWDALRRDGPSMTPASICRRGRPAGPTSAGGGMASR
jgi:tetratricopeptide (TPR) repeat protein